MKTIQHYVLFPNHDNAMRLYKELRALGLKAAIVPTPRAASKCCGVSLQVNETDIETIRQCAAEHDVEIQDIAAVEKDVNPNRDRYC
jgi:hypothetical protein